jgi:hypothetical protein
MTALPPAVDIPVYEFPTWNLGRPSQVNAKEKPAGGEEPAGFFCVCLRERRRRLLAEDDPKHDALRHQADRNARYARNVGHNLFSLCYRRKGAPSRHGAYVHCNISFQTQRLQLRLQKMQSNVANM